MTQGSGTSVAAGAISTSLVLSANSSDITGVTLTDVMTVTDVGIGTWRFHCQLLYQTTATTTGIDVSANHTGTTTTWYAEARHATTGTTATTAAASNAAAGATGNTYEAQGSLTKNAIIGAGTVSVAAINSNHLCTIEGVFIVTVSGNFTIKLAAEAAGLVTRAAAGSNLILTKLS